MPQRIAHFIETNIPGGAEHVLLDLACFTRNHSPFKPVVLHFDHPFFNKRCAELGLEQIIIPEHIHRHFKSTKTLPLFAWQFGRFLKQHAIALLHSHLFGPITGGALAAYVADIPQVATLHDIHMIEEKPSRMLLIKLSALLGTQFVCVSQQMSDFYCARAPMLRSRTRTIYNGLDAIRTTPLTANEQATQRAAIALPIRLERDDSVIICTGRLVKLKQIDLLIRAFSQVQKTLTHCKLLVVGEGPEHKALETLALNLGLEQRVCFTGFREDINQLLACSDVFVQCSTTEGLSRSILEAMASPLPCVVTEVGGNHELITQGENGYLIPVNDEYALSTHLLTLCSDDSLRFKFAQTSLNKIEASFGREKNFLRYVELYIAQLIKP